MKVKVQVFLKKTYDGTTEVVSGGAKLALVTGKVLFKTACTGIKLVKAVNNLFPGQSSSSSSGSNIFPFGMNTVGKGDDNYIPTGFSQPQPPKQRRKQIRSEDSAEENRRRNKAGEPAEVIMDDFISRGKIGPKGSRRGRSQSSR